MKFPELTYTSPVKFSAAQQIQLAVVPPLAWGAISLTRALRSGENSAALRPDAMLGHPARVITAIPVGGYGEVHVPSGT